MWRLWVTKQRQLALSMHCLALWSKNCEHICHGAHWGKRRLVGMVDLTLCARLSKEVSKWLRRLVHSLWSALNISMGARILPVQYSWANIIILFLRGNRRYSLASSLFVRGKLRIQRPEFPCETNLFIATISAAKLIRQHMENSLFRRGWRWCRC